MFKIILFFLLSSSVFSISLLFNTYSLFSDNADFKKYDPLIYQASKVDSLNTDDKFGIVYGDLIFRYDYTSQKTNFYLDISRHAYWGSANFQGSDAGLNPLLVNKLYFTLNPISSLSFSFGRFRYSLGNAIIDTTFATTIDGLQINYKPFEWLQSTIVADVMSIASQVDYAGIYSIIKKDSENIKSFNGDTISLRGGLILNFNIPFVIGIKPYGYYLRYSANTLGGADHAQSGKNNFNKSDGDFLTLSGIRLYKDFINFGNLDFTFAYSYGKDYQFETTNLYNGFALNASYKIENKINIYKIISLISGGYYQPDFISMKAESVGGVLLRGIKSYYNSPYASYYHFRDYSKNPLLPSTIDKTNSKIYALVRCSLVLSSFLIKVHGLFIFESYSKEYMGTEIETTIGYQYDNIKLYATGGVFLPTKYYSKRSVNNITIPNGSDIFYGVLIYIGYAIYFDKEKDSKDSLDNNWFEQQNTLNY